MSYGADASEGKVRYVYIPILYTGSLLETFLSGRAGQGMLTDTSFDPGPRGCDDHRVLGPPSLSVLCMYHSRELCLNHDRDLGRRRMTLAGSAALRRGRRARCVTTAATLVHGVR